MTEPRYAFTPETLSKRWACSQRTVRNLIATGALPSFKLGGKLIRIPPNAVEEFERCRNIDSSGSERNGLSPGMKEGTAFATRSALIAARKQTGD